MENFFPQNIKFDTYEKLHTILMSRVGTKYLNKCQPWLN